MQKRKTPAIEDPVKPASTAELRREGRLTRIAKALASGVTVTEIAEAEGIGRTLASRDSCKDCGPCSTLRGRLQRLCWLPLPRRKYGGGTDMRFQADSSQPGPPSFGARGIQFI